MTRIVTRFAPSPTGYLHVGGARTALFNWLFARHHGGEFQLRIEDTDKARNVEEAVQPIMDGLAWLGIDHDGAIVRQSHNAERHVAVAHELVARGHAYHCHMDAADTETLKAEARSTGRAVRGRDRNAGLPAAPEVSVIRLRAPDGGDTVIDDIVQGRVSVANDTLDDMILLRADGTPTYMLAAVVDDHDMGVTHVIRGDDHLNNAFRQLGILRGMGWDEPTYAHIPLIHDESGRKLSKRHGAVGVEAYRDEGILPSAVFSYLLRLGWGQGDHDIMRPEDAIAAFDLATVGRAPARLDGKRLTHLSAMAIREMDPDAFIAALRTVMEVDAMVLRLAPLVQERSRTLIEARQLIGMTIDGPAEPSVIDDTCLEAFAARRKGVDPVETRALIDTIADEQGVKVKHVIAPIRMAIMGAKVSPPLFEAMEILGNDEIERRLRAATGMPAV